MRNSNFKSRHRRWLSRAPFAPFAPFASFASFASLALAALFACAAICPAPMLAAGLVTEAAALKDARKWQASEQLLRRSVEEEPGSSSYKALAHLLFITGRPAEGLPLYRKALRVDPDDPDAVAGMVECLGDMGRYNQTIEACERAIKRFEKDPKATPAIMARFHLVLAGAQGTAAQKDGVMAMLKYAFSVKKHIDRALELDPAYARAVYGLGVYYREAPKVVGGDPAKGLELLEKAYRLGPDDYGLHQVWIEALIDEGRKDDARRELARYRKDFAGVAAAEREIDGLKARLE